MTALVISKVFPPQVGGTGRWFWELYRRLPRLDYLLAVARHQHQEAFDRTHDLRVARVPLDMSELGILSQRGVTGYWQALRALGQVASSAGAGMTHAGSPLPEGWLALLLKARFGWPYLCFIHGEDVKRVSAGGLEGRMASRELRWMTRAVLSGADLIVVNSRSTEEILCTEWSLPNRRLRLLHPGVDTTRFAPSARCETRRAELGWQGRTVVLTVGRLERRKGHERMIRALHAVRLAFPRILYAIVGDGEERTRLAAFAEREGLSQHVQLLGEVDDEALVNCYQQCDLFVLPNLALGRTIEGFGIVLLEAQACGKPVVAGVSGGTAETMHTPETGRLVLSERSDELAGEVIELLSNGDRLQRMGLAARQWAVEHFDWTVLVPRAQDLFAEIRK
jgi:phosphatidylinositol alpha-1,6-mannosyltransferase